MTIIPSEIPTIDTIYRDWQEGNCTAQEALNHLCHYIAQVQTATAPLEIKEKQARGYVSEIVEYLGGQAEVAGFGELQITHPSITYTYDKRMVDKLTNQLRTEGLGDIATRLDACLKTSERAGSLRINREKVEVAK